MTIANCPRCCEQVSVPASASPEATVQCPLCQEEYPLAEALALLPPALIVIADVGGALAPTATDEEDSPWTALNLDDNDADEISLDSEDAAPAALFEFTSGPGSSGSPSTATIRPDSRSRKPKGSPLKSILSIVIGGMMAFPIAQLILWYLPGDLKRDFGAGPIVARYVPAIVPAKFRGSKGSGQSGSDLSSQDSDVAGSEFNFGSTDKFAGASAVGNANTNNEQVHDRTKKQKKKDFAASTDEPPTKAQMSVADAAAAGEDVFGSSLEVPGLELGGLAPIDEPAPVTNDADVPSTELPPAIIVSPPEVSGLALGNIRNAPQVSADDVVKIFQAASSGNLAWDTDEASSPSGALKRQFYLSFSKLGEALTFADRSDEQVATRVAETAKLLHEIGKQPDKLAVIGSVASGWIAAGREKRTTDGICVHGVVTSVEAIGDLFETTVDSGGQQIAIVSTSDPSEYSAVDRRVLVLGTILEDPAKNLGGYEGEHSVVVLDGYHVNVSLE